MIIGECKLQTGFDSGICIASEKKSLVVYSYDWLFIELFYRRFVTRQNSLIG